MKQLLLLLLVSLPSFAGSFPDVAGTPGSDAISKNSPAFVAWANGNLTPQYGTGVDTIWRTPEKAHGPATEDGSDIVCLGNGGTIIMQFPRPIRDASGPDFAVFENAFTGFLELAFVEVSSDGSNFYRFPNRSEGTALVGAFSSSMDPTTLSGLAGKYTRGYGTPFDLSVLGSTPLLDRQRVRFVRIVDIIGDGSVKDSTGAAIYDPTPTIGSGGFDLEAIGVIHENLDPINDRIGPSLLVTSKLPKFTKNKSLVIKGSSTDPDGIQHVLFKVGKDKQKIATGTTRWQIKPKLKKGKNKITIYATDGLGNVTQKVIKVLRN
jgi:hypothetical protein